MYSRDIKELEKLLPCFIGRSVLQIPTVKQLEDDISKFRYVLHCAELLPKTKETGSLVEYCKIQLQLLETRLKSRKRSMRFGFFTGGE